MNLFLYLQASQRAWRLGADDEVRIYLPFYAGTAAHTKMRKLGGQSGAAAAFSGEPAKGELIKHMGADQTTLARLSASLEDESIFGELDLDAPQVSEDQVNEDLAQIEAAFARRNDELAATLKEGRQWLGMKDQLPERVATVMALRYPDIWQLFPKLTYLPDEGIFVPGLPQVVEESPLSATPPAEVMPEAAIPPAPVEVKEDLPAEPVETVIPAPKPSHPVVSVPVPAQPAALVFGDEEDIRSARKQRGTRPRRTLPRLKNPTTVKDIPAEQLIPTNAKAKQPEPAAEVVVASWWEMSFAEE
jgi:hypothetical protein